MPRVRHRLASLLGLLFAAQLTWLGPLRRRSLVSGLLTWSASRPVWAEQSELQRRFNGTEAATSFRRRNRTQNSLDSQLDSWRNCPAASSQARILSLSLRSTAFTQLLKAELMSQRALPGLKVL